MSDGDDAMEAILSAARRARAAVLQWVAGLPETAPDDLRHASARVIGALYAVELRDPQTVVLGLHRAIEGLRALEEQPLGVTGQPGTGGEPPAEAGELARAKLAAIREEMEDAVGACAALFWGPGEPGG